MSAAEFWRERVSDLRVWKRRGERAPHKPLLTLLLIARASRAEENELRFEDLSDQLTALLREFGPPRASVHPEYPFWHLRSDDFWVVRDADQFTLKQGGSSPTRTALVRGNATGFVKDTLWQELVRNEELRRDVTRRLLEEFWPRSLHASLLESVGLDLDRSPAFRSQRDTAFRTNLLLAYERRCAVCGLDARLSGIDVGLEGAHIRWHCFRGPDVVPNGLLLCSLHHVVFDRGGLGLTEDLRIQVSKHLSGGDATEDWIGRFHGRALQGPRDPSDRPSGEFINWHSREVFRDPSRAYQAE